MLHFSLSVCALLATAGARATATATATATSASTPAAAAPAHTVVVVGDSLSAEYGLARGSGWVSLLGQRLAAEKLDYRVVNASISGDTTAGGLSRLPALLKEQHPKVVVIELGGNDALRGLALDASRRNLESMTALAQAAGARVLVTGILMPPNYGRQYNLEFAKMYTDVAASRKVPLVPFILKGIGDRPDVDDWFQADHIHPVAKAHPIILDNVWPALKPLLVKP